MPEEILPEPVRRLWEMDAVVFDMDGVITDTAGVHASAWRDMFDEYLRVRAAGTGEPLEPFTQEDYLRHVDGKPRYDGVRDFLASRSISLPEGSPDDPPEAETVCGLGNRKNARFVQVLEEGGAEPYRSTVELVEELHRRGIATAVISSSRNCDEVLRAAGVRDLFEVKVDGVDSEELGLEGKPAPDIFLEACRRLGVAPERAGMVEDALSGVEAGRRGGFGLVVGVDRSGQTEELAARGADVVVTDLAELLVTRVEDLPSALGEEMARELAEGTPAVFLDYDGTLTPIVGHPDRALLPDPTRRVLERLAGTTPVAVISGRGLDDVRSMVGLEDIYYAGSHGFEVAGPEGFREERGEEFLAELEAAEAELRDPVEEVPGAWLERKRYALAVHYRQVEDDRQVERLRRAVEGTAERHQGLRWTGGKRIFEVRPDVDWDKGRALLWLLELLGLDRPDVVPLYLGDDETDEDAFRVLRGRGIGVVVGEDVRPTLARYRLADPDQVRELLARLAEGGA